MKILQVASGDFFSTYGGGQVYVKNVVDTLIELGKDVSVISYVKHIYKLQLNEYKGEQLYEVPTNINESELEEIITKIAPDVIHAHSHKSLICRIGYNLKIPVIVTSHHGGIVCPAGTLLNYKDEICRKSVNHKDCLPCVLRDIRTGLRYWYPVMRYLPEKIYDKLGHFLSSKPFIPFITPVGTASKLIKDKSNEWEEIVDKCTCMVAPSVEIANVMKQNGLNPSKIKTLSHGIPMPGDRPDFPPVINGKVKFFYVGRMCYVKGIHILLEAFTAVKNDNIELHLIGGAGNKYEDSYLKQLKKIFSRDDRIKWHGKIAPSSVYDAIREYHVSISPSICLEVFGLNIAEALALGRPVIASYSGGAQMQIIDNENGWLIPANDSVALAEKIEYIATHPDILAKMSSSCLAISIQEHCKQLIEIYESQKNFD